MGALALTSAARADVYLLTGGDRITGRTLSRGKAFSVQTPFGRLSIPRDKVARILHDDGIEEILVAPPSPTPPTPEPPPVELALAVTGKVFWHAWEPPKSAPLYATLRLEVSLDGRPVASYTDAQADPGEIPGAVVNTFSFLPGEVVAAAGGGARVLPPETRPGRSLLRIQLPPDQVGRHWLRLAYQTDAGGDPEPAWRDVTETAAWIELRPGTLTLSVAQDPGRTEFSGLGSRRMRNLDTFRLELRPE